MNQTIIHKKIFGTCAVLLIGCIMLVPQRGNSDENTGNEDLRQADKLMVQKDYNQAFMLYSKAADKGNAEAQANLGVCFLLGIGTSPSKEQAEYWLLKSAKQGYALGQFLLGNLYAKGSTRDTAVKWWRMAADQGFADAQTAMGQCYHQTAFSEEIRHDGPEAVRWFRLAAAQDEKEAQYMLGIIFLNGYDDEDKDPDEAVKWLEKAAAQGHPNAQRELGRIYATGAAGKVDEKKAFELHLLAAKAGHPLEEYEVGRCYELGIGVEKDFEEAVKWYRRAAAQHIPPKFGYTYSSCASSRMGEIRSNARQACQEGKNLLDKKQYKEAINKFKEAANVQHAEGFYWLGRCYQNGWGIEKNPQLAEENLQAAAIQNHTNAQFYLGALYYNGDINGKPNYEEAVKWWLQAKNSSLLAQYWLGNCYANGEGVEKDIQEAIKYWELAARGNADAKTKLGMCYYNGNGVEQNYKKAFYYFNIANFTPEGDYMAGVCSELGQGTRQSYRSAIRLYQLAAKKGHPKAKEALERLEQKKER